MFLAFCRWFGLETFSQSLGHGPSDLVILAYLLFASLVSARGCGLPTITVAASTFGALTMMLELLTGGVPLGIAVVLAVAPWMLGPGATRDQALRAAFASLIAFCAAAATCALVKLLAAMVVFGPEVLSDYLGQLELRMGLNAATGVAPTGGTLLLLRKIVGGLNALTVRNRTMSGLMLLAAALCGAWGLASLHTSRAGSLLRTRAWLIAASNLPIVLWFPLFWQHPIQHAWFMDRILVWILASGFALFLLATIERPASAVTWQR